MKQPAVPFSRPEALRCARLSQEAYTAPPDVHSPLMHVLTRSTAAGCDIVFRGTAEPRDILSDVQALRIRVSSDTGIPVSLPGSVHHGFWDAWQSVRDDVLRWPAVQSGLPITVTGHSLGGAVAQLCAWELARAGRDPISVYTFGGPRVGNAEWVADYNAMLGCATWRVINQVDAVPRVPAGFGYTHTDRRALMNAAGAVTLEPNLAHVLLADLFSALYDLKRRRFGAALLIDHPIADYVARLSF